MSREKQIIEIKECIDAVCGLDCAYLGVDGFAIANKIYDAGYRKQTEGEWLEINDGVLIGDGKHLECSECGVWKKDKQKSNFCSNCGAKMKGGAE